MKQKRVARPRFERLPNVVPVASLTDETDLVSLIRTIVREEVHRLVNQTQESLDSDPQSLEEIIQDEVERVLAPVSAKPTETRPRPRYAAVTRKSRAPVQRFPPQPRKTDVWRTADNRPVFFHCGRSGHVMRYCRERKAVSLTTIETADRTSTTLTLKKKFVDQTPLAVLRQVPREADPQYAVSDPRRHIADPVSRQAVGGRKTKESDLPRRISPTERRIIHEEVQKMLDEGIVQPSESPWSSPVVLVRKKDGSWRFCVDYRKLNSVAKKDVYPLPRIDDTLDCLKCAKFFSSMDLRSGYWQIEIDEADRERRHLLPPEGLYEF
ncbi:hypothetical protein TNCV_2380401 [Trichonephila clavipes]|nr:hypothetical protein TNCV_2380401 [Trichonephila clavipes]